MRKLFLLAVLAVFAVAVPATAKPGNGKSHKCKPHAVGYIASGNLVTWGLTKNADGTYTGTLTVHVTKANKHAKADKGTDKTYTVTGAKVKLGNGVSTPPAAGSKVRVIGKVTTLAKKCSTTGFTATLTIRKIVIHRAK